MNNLAIIPARSGSKGLKDKNIKKLYGKPLIGYSIDAAQKSGVFSEIIVSTDSKTYADISVALGAHVPFLRSAEMSNDTASSWDVVIEVEGQSKMNKNETGEIYICTTLMRTIKPCLPS